MIKSAFQEPGYRRIGEGRSHLPQKGLHFQDLCAPWTVSCPDRKVGLGRVSTSASILTGAAPV